MGEYVMQTFSVRIEDELFRKIEDYRVKRRRPSGSVPSRNEVIAELIQKGLEIGK